MEDKSKMDKAYDLVNREGIAAKDAGHMDGWYACNRVLRTIDEARRILNEPPQQKGLEG